MSPGYVLLVGERHNERDLLQFIDCTHRGREHTPWDGNPDDGPPPYVCIACWTDTRHKETPA